MPMTEQPQRMRAQFTLKEELARFIRERFVTCYRGKAASLGKHREANWTPNSRWDGGQCGYRKYRSHWLKCAGVFQQWDLPVIEYVYFVVFEMSPTTLPSPDALVSSQVISRYNRHEKYGRPQRLLRHEAAFHSQITALRNDMHEKCQLASSGLFPMTADALRRSSLVDHNVALTPLFRFCVADQSRLTDVARRFFRPAAQQYICESRYFDDVWKELIPAGFRQHVLNLFGMRQERPL